MHSDWQTNIFKEIMASQKKERSLIYQGKALLQSVLNQKGVQIPLPNGQKRCEAETIQPPSFLYVY